MKITTIRLAALATMLAAASFGAHAAETADLAVQGMIRPSACNVSLSGNGTVDYGTISALTLSETAGTALPSRDFTLSVNCDAPTVIGFVTTDNRAGTVSNTAGRATGALNDLHYYGVGAVDGRNIGAYQIYRSTATADGSPVALFWSQNSGSTWSSTTDRDWGLPGIRTHSWGATDATTPGAYSSIVQQFTLRLGIAPTSELPPLDNSIAIDGLATFTLVYL
jgi:type 1 fimbria pilin